MDWKHNKLLFNYIVEQDYLIKKDIETNNILFIKWEQFEMKCKYFLAFSIETNNEIIWSCNNPYMDQRTKYLSNVIKTNLHNNNKFSMEFLNDIKNIIQTNSFTTFQDEKITFIWCLKGTFSNFKHFYIITEIICI
jgi:hypothetical protein